MKMVDYERRLLGDLAHRVVADQFLQARRGHCLVLDRHLYIPNYPEMQVIGDARRVNPERGELGNRFRNGADALDPYLDMLCWILQTRKSGAWFLEPSAPGVARRPDLADIELHEVYEVKPDTVAAGSAGRIALSTFQALLSQADAEYRVYSAQSKRYAGELYDSLSCHHWHGGAWIPQTVTATGPNGDPITFTFRGCPSAAGVLLWRVVE